MKNLESSSAVAKPTAQPASVTIRLDGQPHQLAAGSTLADLVTALGHAPEAVSTALNGEFVARNARDRVLAEGDAVLLFQPIVGG